MTELVKFVDICIANEEDCQMALGVQTDVDVHSGRLEAEKYNDLTKRVLDQLPERQDAGHHAARIP